MSSYLTGPLCVVWSYSEGLELFRGHWEPELEFGTITSVKSVWTGTSENLCRKYLFNQSSKYFFCKKAIFKYVFNDIFTLKTFIKHFNSYVEVSDHDHQPLPVQKLAFNVTIAYLSSNQVSLLSFYAILILLFLTFHDPWYKRVQQVGLISLSCNWVIFHYEINHMLVKFPLNSACIVLYYQNL